MRGRAVLILLVAACSNDAGDAGDAGGGPGLDGGAPDSSLDATPDARPECLEVTAEPCDFFLSCGCDVGAGEKCSIGQDGIACAQSGELGQGEACAGDGECASGTICATYADGAYCMMFCDDAHVCAENYACFIAVMGDEDVQVASVCGQVCTLLEKDCAHGSVQGCFPTSMYDIEAERGLCLDDGSGTQGEDCDDGCASGYACVDPEGETGPICAQLCDRDDDDPACDSGTCRALTGHSQTGVCLPG